ncbi:spectrin alpha chain-like [Temnothorax longispinosus]
MTKSCAVPMCKSRNYSAKKCSLFKVPSNIEQCKKWIAAIPGIVDLKPSQFVCEKHFEEHHILKKWVKYDNDRIIAEHFDKDKSGRLNHQEFKSCLRALGYDFPMMEEGQPDPEFENILDIVDPNRDSYVSLQEYMAFMISKETENVQSSEEIENAFRAITAADRPYVTKEELYANLTKEMADYCVARMKPYVDPKSERPITAALDYIEFTRTLFQN